MPCGSPRAPYGSLEDMVETITGHANVIEALRGYASRYAAKCTGRVKDAAEKTNRFGVLLGHGGDRKSSLFDPANDQGTVKYLEARHVPVLHRQAPGSGPDGSARTREGRGASLALGLDDRRDAIPDGVGQAFPRLGDPAESGVVLGQKHQAICRDTVAVVRAFRRNPFVCATYV